MENKPLKPIIFKSFYDSSFNLEETLEKELIMTNKISLEKFRLLLRELRFDSKFAELDEKLPLNLTQTIMSIYRKIHHEN